MTKKKKTTRARRRWWAHQMANTITLAAESHRLPKRYDVLVSKFFEEVPSIWARCIANNIDDPVEFLQMVVDALKGELRPAKFDFGEAYHRAWLANREAGRDPQPSTKQLLDVFQQDAKEKWKRSRKPSEMPSERSVQRWAEIEGWAPLSPKPGPKK